MAHAVVHFEIGGPDDQQLADFYAQLFGWSMRPIPDIGYTLVGGVRPTLVHVERPSDGIPPIGMARSLHPTLELMRRHLRHAGAIPGAIRQALRRTSSTPMPARLSLAPS